MLNKKHTFGTYLDVAFKISSIVGVFFIARYVYDTDKILEYTQKQYIASLRPFIDIVASPQPTTIKNKSNNVALNVFVFHKTNNTLTTLDPSYHVGTALSPDGTEFYDFSARTGIENVQNALAKKSYKLNMEKDIFCQQFPSLTKLINYLFSKKETAITCIVYEDILGNKLYTLIKGSEQQFAYSDILETGYLKDLD